ncbi:M15 family metallopeptidase [Bradyrhizobium japonicum]|uniref:M15 family metallopeptidase n=1 Tax=Bradyrhizobium japonicum TaxID=375 RepID=UPI0004B160D7|nr:M15 family metallopeptidase [Bradyrhizobium japonicum]MCD9819805.1 M15 family metallopeptidase [Bradyrhizobium japonicum]MEB2675150.1 M15 family metallopeptidase [Bradyrhizobium japonicum]WLB25023.1 M15 family metallopeptidase [Bradyrhizobium japonicum]WRI85527.1 M15 family metallopeptidase [Bradyrhizobium japonicum]
MPKSNAAIWPKDNQAARNAFYGDPGKGQIAPQMVPVVPPFAMYYEGRRVKAIQFHRKAAPALLAALNEIWDYCGRDQKKIDAAGVSNYAGAYYHRMVRGSSTKWSNHAYAAAIDLNAGENALGVKKGTMPQFVVDAFCRQGAMWGGWYTSRPDWMHFEFVDNGGRKPKSAAPAFGRVVMLAHPETGAPVDELEDPAPASSPPAAPPNVQPLDPDVRGDAVLYDVQRRLKARRYSPGVLDGRWGSGTSGALSGFMNDRGLALVLPSSVDEFHGIADQVRAELARAETEIQPDGSIGWYRPVSAARAGADPKIVTQLAPEVVPARRNFLVALWSSIAAGAGAVWQTVSDSVTRAWDFFTDHRDVVDDHPGLVSTVWEHVTALPSGVWLLLGAGGLAFIAYNSWRAIKTSTLAVTTGERQ